MYKIPTKGIVIKKTFGTFLSGSCTTPYKEAMLSNPNKENKTIGIAFKIDIEP